MTTLDYCPGGHRYTAANTRFERNGWRRCRACHAANERTRRLIAKIQQVIEANFALLDTLEAS